MNEAELFLSPMVLLLAVVIFLIVESLRRAIQFFYAGAKNSKLMREMVWPLAPLLVGMILSLTELPLPVEGVSGRLMLGAACGQFSGWLYGRVKAIIKAKGSPES